MIHAIILNYYNNNYLLEYTYNKFNKISTRHYNAYYSDWYVLIRGSIVVYLSKSDSICNS